MIAGCRIDIRGTISKETDVQSITTFEYYQDLASNVISTFQPYIALSPKLVKNSSTSYFGGTEVVTNYTYMFDEKKRII